MSDMHAMQAYMRKFNRFFIIVIIPLLGIAIPNIAGLISNERYTWWQLILWYACFISAALVIWKGNAVLFRRFRKDNQTRSAGYFKMLASYLFASILYSSAVTVSLFFSMLYLSGGNDYTWRSLFYVIAMVVVGVILVTVIYELVSLRLEIEDADLKYKRMEIAKVQAELEALKAQIEPHFILNALNTLSYLIVSKPETATYYNQALAKVYRYILLNKDKDLVFLKDELDFITNYFYLIKIRFEEGVSMIVDIPEGNRENFLITPVSLQMLVENAVKHNYFSSRNPLIIRINIQSYFVAVRNRIKNKEFKAPSSGIGLKNLKERYQLIMKRNIIIRRDNEEFLVKVPILKV